MPETVVKNSALRDRELPSVYQVYTSYFSFRMGRHGTDALDLNGQHDPVAIANTYSHDDIQKGAGIKPGGDFLKFLIEHLSVMEHRIDFKSPVPLRMMWFVPNRRLRLHHWLLGHIVQVGTQELRAFDVISLVQLLIDAMRGVRAASHGQ